MPATVTVDCGSAKSADYAVVYGHDLYTQGATLEIRGSTDNFGASDVLVATMTPTSNNPFLLQFASASYRYWRVRVTGATAPSLAIVSMGVGLDIPSFCVEGFDPIGRKLKGQYNRSVQGNPLGRVILYEEWAETLKFELVNETTGWTWVRNTFLPAWRAHLRSKPFIFVWEPVSHSDELYLVASKDEFQTPHKVGQYIDLTMPVVGLAT